MKNKPAFTISIALALCACGTPRHVTYFQGLDDLSHEQLEAMTQKYDTKICEDDMLTINVTAWNPEAAAPYNPPAYGYYPPAEGDASENIINLYTYLVDKDGNVNFPVLGKVHLAGLSVEEANAMLEKMIKPSVPDALVNVQIINFRVGIFGEVARNNSYVIRKNRISILELITMAGDLTINANRQNILLIRETNGEKEFVRLDITDPNIFASPYFYLKQNDLVYVEPNKAKQKNANYSSAQSYTLTMFSTIMTGISVISTIILAVSR
jgi:polysaccharide export outer membrane protein